jgi:hypothetical protein
MGMDARASIRRLRQWSATSRGQSRIFGLAGLVLAGWTIFAGRQWLPITLSAAAPWIALAINRAASGELGFERWIRVGEARWKRIIPRFWDLASWPVIALFVIGLLDFQPVSLTPFIVIPIVLGSVVAALFFSAAEWRPPRHKRDWTDIGLGTIGFWGYAFGCMSILNGMLSQAPPSQFEGSIVSKYIHGGRSHARMFDLGPWGPFSGGGVQGTLIMYDRLNAGDSVCMLLHPGGLGLPWWEIAPWTAKDADPHCYPDGAPPPRRVTRTICKGDEVSAATCS